MRITNLAIKNRIAVVVLTAIIVVGGLIAYVTIPKESAPQIEFATIVVTTIYPGASPDDIESIITQEVEREIATINGIDDLRSTSTEGVSTVVIEFTPDVDVDQASIDVREAVDRAKAEFPAEVEEPIVSELDSSEFPIITINLAADYSLAQLRDLAEDLEDAIEAQKGVLEVDLIGGLEREVQVNVDLNALQGYNLTFSDLIGTIQGENTNIPGGSIDIDRLNYLVRVDGEFEDPSEIESLVIDAPGGTPVYVRDVADVQFGFKDRASYARLEVLKTEIEDGVYQEVEGVENLQVISLIVKKRPGENIIETVGRVREAVGTYPIPTGTEITYTGDESQNVQTLVADLQNNIISGLLFVIAVLLFFLGVRNATLVGIAIPLSMLLSFIIFSVMGETLNFVILFSLIIALGMLVDNAVVIVENIYRFREEGYSRWEAAKEATAEVGGAVAASTATTVAAFAPMLFWPGIIGKFMGYLPLTLIVTLSASLFIALVINPVITGYLVRLEGEEGPKRSRAFRRVGYALVAFTALIVGLTNWKTLVFAAVAIPLTVILYRRVLAPIASRFQNESMPRLTERYRHFLRWMLQRDYSRRAPLGQFRKSLFLGGGLVALGGMMIGTVMNPEGPVSADSPAGQGLMMGGLVLALAGVIVLLARVKDAMFRNVFALGAFTLGFLLLIVGASLSALSEAAGMIAQMPGMLLLLAGVLGIVVHALASAFVGGRTSIKVGLIAGAVIGVLAVLLILAGRIDVGSTQGFRVLIGMLGLPGVVVLAGVLGTLFAKDRDVVFLTDNRARLLTGTLSMLVAILVLFNVAPTGVVFFPDTDPNIIQVKVEAPLGTNIEASDRMAEEVFERVQRLVDEDPTTLANTETVLTQVGVGGDILFGGGAAAPENSTITVDMVDYGARAESSAETMRRLRRELQGIPGAEISFTKDQAGPPTGAPVNIEVSGQEFDEIVRISQEIKARLAEGLSEVNPETGAPVLAGLVDVSDNLNTGRPELQVRIDRERAARFGLSTSQIATTVRAAINGIEASTYRTGEDEYDITVRLQEDDRESLEALRSLTILYEGSQIPLVAVADVNLGSGLGSVTRLDQQRVVTVTGDAAEGVNPNELLGRVQGYLAPYVEEALPPGYTVTYTGESEDQAESFGFLTTALLIAIALISMILIAQFNSVKNPLIIMIAVGLSLIGVMLGLILTRTAFGLMTFIGLISLAGIVVNNAIVLVDYIEQLRDRGEDKQEAVIDGGATRLRPVLLTAFTTVIGLIPLTFGINIDFIGLITDLQPNFGIGSENTQFWGPMGTAIISGLTFATFLTLVIVPVMYSAFDSVAARLGAASQRASDATTDGLAPTAPLTPAAVAVGDGSGNGAAVEPTPSRP
ncbi:MAG: efflux RND transporter permease subunit [Rubricoccaceae bacterium]|nr:efflux RND transporter permease subunit [Rubricoccaceae bacterium]